MAASAGMHAFWYASYASNVSYWFVQDGISQDAKDKATWAAKGAAENADFSARKAETAFFYCNEKREKEREAARRAREREEAQRIKDSLKGAYKAKNECVRISHTAGLEVEAMLQGTYRRIHDILWEDRVRAAAQRRQDRGAGTGTGTGTGIGTGAKAAGAVIASSRKFGYGPGARESGGGGFTGYVRRSNQDSDSDEVISLFIHMEGIDSLVLRAHPALYVHELKWRVETLTGLPADMQALSKVGVIEMRDNVRTLGGYKVGEGAVVTVTRVSPNALEDEEDAPLVDVAAVYTPEYIVNSAVRLMPSQCSFLGGVDADADAE
jgi:hypothetical protein